MSEFNSNSNSYEENELSASLDIDFSGLKVAEFKAELRKRGFKVSGKKDDLVDRLIENYHMPIVASGEPRSKTPKKSKGGKKSPKKLNKSKQKRQETLVKAIRTTNMPFSQALAILLQTYDIQNSQLLEQASELNIKDLLPPVLDVADDEEELKKLKVVELKKILKERGQKVSGKKADLIERILNPETVVDNPQTGSLPPMQIPDTGVHLPDLPVNGSPLEPLPEGAVNLGSTDSDAKVILPNLPDLPVVPDVNNADSVSLPVVTESVNPYDEETEEIEEEKDNLPLLPEPEVVGHQVPVPSLPVVGQNMGVPNLPSLPVLN